MIRPVTVCWVVVAVSLTWFTFDTYRMVVERQYLEIPAWQKTLVGYALATLTAFLVALMTALATRRWAGIVLVIASVALGAIPVVTALALAACHGCSESGLGTLVIFLVYSPIAVFSLLDGIRRASGSGGETV